MVAPAGIYAEAAVDAAQQGGYFIRLAHGGILVVKNIARQHHHVRLRLINLLHHALHLRRTHIITKMQIGHKGNAQLTLLRGSARLVHRDRLFAQHHALRMQNPPCADALPTNRMASPPIAANTRRGWRSPRAPRFVCFHIRRAASSASTVSRI